MRSCEDVAGNKAQPGEGVAAADIVVMVTTAGSAPEAAEVIGNACVVRGNAATGLVLTADAGGEALGRDVAGDASLRGDARGLERRGLHRRNADGAAGRDRRKSVLDGRADPMLPDGTSQIDATAAPKTRLSAPKKPKARAQPAFLGRDRNPPAQGLLGGRGGDRRQRAGAEARRRQEHGASPGRDAGVRGPAGAGPARPTAIASASGCSGSARWCAGA